MQLAVRDCMVAADAFAEVVGAEKVREDELRVFNAKRTVVQAGESEFELLEPAGDGAVASHLERWGEGIFAAGFSTDNPGALARRMDDRALRFREEGGQIFIEPDQTRGMRTVISRWSEREPVGLISSLYEVTNIVEDHEGAASFYADAFGLDASRFCPIKSEQWGYTGTLTLFDPPSRLDRIELTQITEPSLAMGRFFARRGPSISLRAARKFFPKANRIQLRDPERGLHFVTDARGDTIGLDECLDEHAGGRRGTGRIAGRVDVRDPAEEGQAALVAREGEDV